MEEHGATSNLHSYIVYNIYRKVLVCAKYTKYICKIQKQREIFNRIHLELVA